MNLEVFNRVNWKEGSGGRSGMYCEWASLSLAVQNCGELGQSVLNKFPAGSCKEVVTSVIKQLSSNLGITQPPEPSKLIKDNEVIWCMEVICYGLSLPLSEHDTIRDCVHIYCDWLSSLYETPKISVPKPVCNDPNLYARKIISHFYNLFVPRKGEVWTFIYLNIGADAINRQAVLCHRVLRTLHDVSRTSKIIEAETWEALLLFLLAINDALLAPPTIKDVGEELCERVLSVLIEVWLVACVRCFPSPSMWKTLREMAITWRHRTALIHQWNRINLALTSRLLTIMYGPDFPQLKLPNEDVQLIPPEMSNDTIAQSWFRLLQTIGNPADLSRPSTISRTPKFLQAALSDSQHKLVDPTNHPCLNILPYNFYISIRGIASLVDAFLGIPSHPTIIWDDVLPWSMGSTLDKKDGSIVTQTPPSQRRLAKSFSVAPTLTNKGIPKSSLVGLTTSRINTQTNKQSTSTISISSTISEPKVFAENRPHCNSILHLFGEWLFEAALLGVDFNKPKQATPDSRMSKRPSSVMFDTTSIKSGGSGGYSSMGGGSTASASQPNSLTDNVSDSIDSINLLNMAHYDRYLPGRAEAIGTLCRIFCSKKTSEEILPVYLARFYMTVCEGLHVNEMHECDETITSILLNSNDLFRLDLSGINVLVPYIIETLELVLPERDLKLRLNTVSKSELRRSAINLLLSLVSYPLHFKDLTIKELNSSSNMSRGSIIMGDLKPRVMNLLINALQNESDSHNCQMLLGGLLCCVQDSAFLEESENDTESDTTAHSDTPSNLLSSVDTMSSFSLPSSQHDQMVSLFQTNASNTPESSLEPAGFYFSDAFDFSILNKNSAHALYIRATYLVCHRLISSWKSDLNISLAALELLMGLARVNIRDTDSLECKRAVKWLCDYITYQCWRPPPAHSRDLHSTIVAAYQCAAVWLVAHPYLLDDKDCLNTVIEVVELGISGTKSHGKPQESIKMKDEKELKPASMRVRDAAESLLAIILEQVGSFPSICGAESLSCLLDEITLIKHCNSIAVNNMECKSHAVSKFRYFVLENSIILALFEEPLGNDQDAQPTLTVLIRSSFGRQAWTLQLRHLPRHRSSSSKQYNTFPGRPVPMEEPNRQKNYRKSSRHFSEVNDQISMCKMDKSIPSLDSLVFNDEEHNILSNLIEKQKEMENLCSESLSKTVDIMPPQPCTDFSTARLFLSHFGFLSRLDDVNSSSVPSLVALNANHENFYKDLEILDNTPSRTCDTCHIFYVKDGQKNVKDILMNVTSSTTVTPKFLEILTNLGWPVNVNEHPGWTGRIETSWNLPGFKNTSNQKMNTLHGGNLYNGESHVIYWADVSSEIAFVVPSHNVQEKSPKNEAATNSKHETFKYTKPMASRTVSVDFDDMGKPTQPFIEPPKRRPQFKSATIMLVWLESFEDHLHFPIADLLTFTNTGLEPASYIKDVSDVHVIYLHELQSGLLRVKIQGPFSRTSIATPLVDGIVISKDVVGSMVRQTALNICRRKRLENDSFQPGHIRRRLKIQEILGKYQIKMTKPELYTYLLNNTNLG
ncbi:ral GTPase-activating protein subunit beta isoform X2 [Daktulosphaira vitifoliae]|uniref:ral GTPase-activating protein subunit beta isoform X2 n=1 Tax=Daktulosphaira vitifoliae TaxID=58002 RepID=UPI0021AAD8C4|nr:ral GTPase-activating protein subunit beta isoform X2 [Daktulosphaira vitifoliae]